MGVGGDAPSPQQLHSSLPVLPVALPLFRPIRSSPTRCQHARTAAAPVHRPQVLASMIPLYTTLRASVVITDEALEQANNYVAWVPCPAPLTNTR